ncbi:hypothetical protein ABT297_22420 [Dactylosporangium sp. NPDC000555]|uniref:hypothetical protein n=1 Tax=Dactylosporangium sp. NPDC000555 TaxID=3154260 RepID=UPI0033201EFC
MNSTTITIGLVVLALAVGGWILLRGGKEEEEETGAGAVPPAQPVQAAPAAPRPPTAAGVPQSAPMSSVPYGQPGMGGGYGAPPAAAPGTYGTPSAPAGGMYGGGGGGGGQFMSSAPLTSEAHAYEVRTRWQELQLRFVDDPQTAAGEAERLVDDALAGVTASLNARKDQLSSWRVSGRDDTEQLRAAVHGYRDFLNHLVGT